MEKIVVFTGAGMSADSGLRTFRDADGLWEGHAIQEVATPEGWQKNPEKVLNFYNERRKQAWEVDPHAGHKALTELENQYDVTIVTQNVDSLHERAGSSDVVHLHGNLSKARSEKDPSLIIDIGSKPIEIGDTAEDGEQLRPHVVWFGERVPNMDKAAQIMRQADIIIVIGTSLVVYPAAGLIDYVPSSTPGYLVDPAEHNREDLKNWNHIQEKAVYGVPKLVDKLIN